MSSGSAIVLAARGDGERDIRIILLVDAYARSQWAAVATRIHTLELEATVMPIEERSRFHGLVGKAPALRERREDIPLLPDRFVDFFNQRQLWPEPVTSIDDDALSALQNYDWLGNVRELSNAIEGAFIFGRSPVIALANLPVEIARQPAPSNNSRAVSLPIGSFADAERDIIARALDMAAGNKEQAARNLKISRKRLYAKIEKYGLVNSDGSQSS